jgi:hypothetical protein
MENSNKVFPLDKTKKWQLQQMWRERFAIELKKNTGKWIFNNEDWHTFNHGYTPCIKGAKAEFIYNNLKTEQFYVLSSNEGITGYFCKEGILPKSIELKNILSKNNQLFDLYITSYNFSWTMVFVHESDMGPYYCRINNELQYEEI